MHYVVEEVEQIEYSADMALAEPCGQAGPGAAPGAAAYAPLPPPRELGVGEDMVEAAIARLRLAWCAHDPDSPADRWIASAEWPFRELALALEGHRRDVSGRLAVLGMARLEAQARGLQPVIDLARRLPRGLSPTRGAGLGGTPEQGAPRLEDLVAMVSRAAELLAYGWRGLSASAVAAWAVGHGVAGLGLAAENPTVAWLGSGAIADAGPQGPSSVLDGAIDSAVLRALRASAEGRVDESLAIARAHSASLQDAAEQVECAVAALDAIDLRVQEVTWLLGRLDMRLGPAAHHAGLALCMLEARAAPAAPPTGVGLMPAPAPAPRATEMFPREREALVRFASLGGALYRMATVRVLDDAGRLTRHSGETVAGMRRLLLAQG
ncbi:hypothetical protein M4R22_12615 [Acidovorax sp. GBBC 3334]|uniref:hypothetical protein n=1 Tax=Acidovorax sp. GBBC 3334 TaxID=2940496 RepID=UPI0023022416|nr:hypothetical protein [Acidovorax sp. GBBC 3334]MDA8455608.1 hypothetical protein [Acidovorax sp. GBBC 3334]